MSATSPALQAIGLRKSYPVGTVETLVLRGLDLEARAGELLLVCGPSGCGKSTLLALLGALLLPDAGRVLANGIDLGAMDASGRDRFRLAHCGFVFQGCHLFPALTALDQVLLPLSYLGIGEREARRRAMEALAEVDLADKQSLKPGALSGGEKQRVAVARALAKQPRLLFADEPTSALDSENGRKVIGLLRTAAARHGSAVVCVSHDARLIERSDRVVQMEDGRLLRDWRPAARAEATSGDSDAATRA